MCSRYNIAALQRQAEASQVGRRSDGTPIYRLASDRWADIVTLKAMLGKLIGQMEALQAEVRKATGKEAPQFRGRSLQLQARLMNYQTGIKKIQEITDVQQ